MTSEERREAAERLREWRPFEPGEERCFVNAWQSLGRAVGATPGEEISGRIADLIDPTCKMRLDAARESFFCTSCGARVVRTSDSMPLDGGERA